MQVPVDLKTTIRISNLHREFYIPFLVTEYHIFLYISIYNAIICKIKAQAAIRSTISLSLSARSACFCSAISLGITLQTISPVSGLASKITKVFPLITNCTSDISSIPLQAFIVITEQKHINEHKNKPMSNTSKTHGLIQVFIEKVKN